MVSSKIVTPVKTGVQCLCDRMKSLDSGFHRNDDLPGFRRNSKLSEVIGNVLWV
jgi:hypothetical protein